MRRFCWANDPYVYPDNLPIVAAKGGPGGKPSCGSLPDATKNFPVRQLVTNTGWGTGMDSGPILGSADIRVGANFLPVTRAVPEPPSVRCAGSPRRPDWRTADRAGPTLPFRDLLAPSDRAPERSTAQ